MVNPNSSEVKKAVYTPSCAAAPSSRVLGLAITGPKSVMAPRPRKIRGGYQLSFNAVVIKNIEKTALISKAGQGEIGGKYTKTDW